MKLFSVVCLMNMRHLSMIANTDISFVVQGPVQSFNGRAQQENITIQCLQSIRFLFPGSPIILSTWKGQKTTGLDYDILLTLDDPGQNLVFNNNQAQLLNNNRQLVSTHQGLKEVKTPYAVKIRTDNKLSGRQFVDIYEKFFSSKRKEAPALLRQRVLTSSAFFISHHRGEPNYFCKSDLFDFGLTEDLLKIWSDKLLETQYFFPDMTYKSRPPATEQFLCLKWLSEQMGQKLHINNRVNDDAGLGIAFWENCIANNLIIATPEEIGLDVTERFYQRGNLIFEYDLEEWQVLAGITKKRIRLKSIIKSVRNHIEKTKRFIHGLF